MHLKNGGKNITSKKPSIKTLAGKKIDKFEDYALHSDVFRKLSNIIINSAPYSHISKKFSEFRDYKLIEQIKQNKVPEHVAIIMDGNRRYAKELGLPPDTGHIYGKEKLEEVLEWCFDLGIKNLTVYAFSTENFDRDSTEVRTLMSLCKEELQRASKDSRIHKNKVKIRVIGRMDALPEDIAKSAQYIMDETKEYGAYSFNIALAYGGREEIINAIQKIAIDVKNKKLKIEDINEPIVSKYLYTNGIPDPDLILRTSGEERISNFLLWQLAYSELYFSDVFWPAFQKRDFLKAIITCQLRNRRFGK